MEALLLPGQQDGLFHSDNTQPPAETSVFSLLSLKGKTAIVTGAGAGIGFAVVEAFAEAGANVALWYRSNNDAVEKAAKISKKYNIECRAYQVEITNEEEVEKAVEQAVRDLSGRLDVFVANAAIPWFNGRIIDSNTADFMKVLNVNFVSVYYAAKAVGRLFRRQKEELLNIFGEPLTDFSAGSFIVTSSGSTSRQLTPQAMVPYSSCKAALENLVKGLALEWIPFARVNSICPGYITTEMLCTVPDDIRKLWKGQTPMG
ncbi:hypothetical protein ABW21_db0200735 [Orbilia brochopaga]|nr:hypothetical protein ABW21_db0200735 [Drechslerella brochopaga]